MGRYKCATHGLVNLPTLCQHIADEIDQGRYPVIHRAWWVQVCEACVHKYDLTRFLVSSHFDVHDPELSEADWDAFSRASEKIPTTYRCPECMAVVQVKYARQRGQQEPFPTYEKTLTSHDRDLIDGLNAVLIHGFSFQQSIVDAPNRAVFIQAGAYTYPLTVTSYYVTTPTEQDRIVEMVWEYLEH